MTATAARDISPVAPARPPEGTALSASGPCAEPALVAIGLGANLGDRGQALAAAVQAMARWPLTELVAVSSLYSSAPIDSSGPDYLNAVALVRSRAAPLDFLHQLQALEHAAGRLRPYRNAPRTLDLDIELWGSQQIDHPELSVPHPRMWERAFVLQPLAEIWPEMVQSAQLQAVAGQGIAISQPQGWWHK